MPPVTHHALSFDQAVEGFLRAHGQLSFLQIGGYDGVSFDPLREHILKGDLTGVIVEPVPMHFEKLQALYAGSDRIKVENCAVDATEGERTMWFFSREAIAKGTIGQVFGGITSFLLPNLLEKGGTLGGLYSEENRAILNSLVESISVPCHTYDTIIARNGLQRIDLLQIDTEGYDYELLKVFDFQRHRPAIVHYECQHLNPQDKAAAEQLLRSHGYVLSSNGYDTLALRGILIQEQAGDVLPLVGVGNQLLNEGRNAQASEVFRYVLQIDPGNFLATVNAALAATRQGLHPEAVRLIGRARPMAPANINLTPYVEDIFGRAAQVFNDLVEKDNVAAGEAIIDALAEVDPGLYLTSALSIARNLERTEKVVAYARQILDSDPLSWPAHAALYTEAERRGDVAGRIFHVAQAAMS